MEKIAGNELKKSFMWVILVVLIIFTSVTLDFRTTKAQPVKPIELKLNFLWPSEAQQVKGAYQPWINEIEKRSNGKVKITPYYLNSLAPIQEAYNAAITGIADISELDLQMHPGLFQYA